MPKKYEDDVYSSEDMSRTHTKRKHKDKYHNRENRDHQRHKYRSRSPHRVRVKREETSQDRSLGRNKHRKHRDGYKDRRKHYRSREEHHRQVKQEPVDDIHEQRKNRQQNDERRREKRRQNSQFNEDLSAAFGVGAQNPSNEVKIEKEGPNFEVSGKLAEDTNTYKGVVIKYNEPAEARKPKKRWRLYPFKGDNVLPMLHIHRQSAYLLGRDRVVVDIPTDHPSCSKQHAVLQYRLVDHERDDGSIGRRVKPYIIDLDSSNGTFVNNQKIESRCYVELFEKDVLKFGFSSREYVLLHDSTQDDKWENDPGELIS